MQNKETLRCNTLPLMSWKTSRPAENSFVQWLLKEPCTAAIVYSLPDVYQNGACFQILMHLHAIDAICITDFQVK